MLGCCRLRRFGEGGPGLLAEDARGGAGVSPPGSSSVPIPPAPGDTSASGARRVTRTGAACSCGTSAAGLSAAGEPGVSLPPASCAAASAVALPPPCSPSRFDARLDKYHAAAASAPTTSAPLHQHRSAAAGDTKRAQATVSSSKASSRRVGTEPRPVPPVRGHARPLPLGRGLRCTDPGPAWRAGPGPSALRAPGPQIKKCRGSTDAINPRQRSWLRFLWVTFLFVSSPAAPPAAGGGGRGALRPAAWAPPRPGPHSSQPLAALLPPAVPLALPRQAG